MALGQLGALLGLAGPPSGLLAVLGFVLGTAARHPTPSAPAWLDDQGELYTLYEQGALTDDE